jgi:hypothetical protein
MTLLRTICLFASLICLNVLASPFPTHSPDGTEYTFRNLWLGMSVEDVISSVEQGPWKFTYEPPKKGDLFSILEWDMERFPSHPDYEAFMTLASTGNTEKIDYTFSSVVLGFFKGKVMSINVEEKKRDASWINSSKQWAVAVTNSVQTKYGEPKIEDDFEPLLGREIYSSLDIDKQTLITVSVNESDNLFGGTISFTSIPMLLESREERKNVKSGL